MHYCPINTHHDMFYRSHLPHRLSLILATASICSMLMGQGPSKRFAPGEAHPYWMGFDDGLAPADLQRALWSTLGWPASNGLRSLGRPFTDRIGQEHERYERLFNGIPVHGGAVVVHSEGGLVKAVNGTLMPIIGPARQGPAQVSPTAALEFAKRHVAAIEYMWESTEREAFLKRERHDDRATFLPEARMIWYPVKRGDVGGDLRLAYKLDVYARKPMSRQDVVVDAITGEVLASLERIHHLDEPGTAQTAYSGSRPIITYRPGTPADFELRDMSRGGGIHTYDCLNTADYDIAQVPTQTTNTWDFGDAVGNTILDAHWGTEMTYDFYLGHDWDSFDNAGSALLSYAHFNLVDFGYPNNNNAFWDGERMTYGDGDGTGFNPLTALDVVGHEITHGVTEHSAGLEYFSESGALNESFSDIFGSCVEHFARPEDFSWLLGSDMNLNGEAFRDMSDPNLFECPDTYHGDFWDDEFEEVHTNSGVQNFWFYLLCEGGTGVNDNGDTYAVQGIGMEDAAAIAFRNLSVYLGMNSDYAEARTYSIQAALDLFGECSDQVTAVTNAWHAVGVGEVFTDAVIAQFLPSTYYVCSLPAEVHFTDLSLNTTGYQWAFDDGGTSNEVSPTHTYTSAGTYTVSLIATGTSACNSSDTAWSMPIVVDDLPAMAPANCAPTATDPTGTGGIFGFSFAGYERTSDGALSGYEDLSCESNITVMEGLPYPLEVELETEGNVGLWVDLDGDASFSADELVYASGAAALTHEAEFIIPAGVLFDTRLRLRVVSDVLPITSPCALYNGQAEDYAVTVLDNNAAPIAAFAADATTVLPGTTVNFDDLSLNVPTNWSWDLPGGDITTSTSIAPQVTYGTLGVYDVRLIVSNAFGSDTLLMPGYITVVNSANMCGLSTVTSASGVIYDTGGAAGEYQDEEDCTILIAPPCAESLTLTFTAFSVEEGYDYLTVHDGFDESAPVIGIFTGYELPPPITASSGAIFLHWTSDYSVTGPGYIAEWEAITGSQDPVVAQASADNLAPAFAAPVQFTDNSSGSPTDRLWDFGDGATSGLPNPVHAYLMSGPKTVTLTVGNCGFMDVDTLQLVVGPGGIGMDEADLSGISVFPNPTDGRFIVRNDGEAAPLVISILDATGRAVSNARSVGKGDARFDISGLSDGVYLLRLRSGDQERHVRLTKQ